MWGLCWIKCGVCNIPKLEKCWEIERIGLAWRRKQLKNTGKMRLPTTWERWRGSGPEMVDARKRKWLVIKGYNYTGKVIPKPAQICPFGTGGGQLGCLPPGRSGRCREALGKIDLYLWLLAVNKRMQNTNLRKFTSHVHPSCPSLTKCVTKTGLIQTSDGQSSFNIKCLF